ncbi:MAG TPA: hypothetical protein VM934_06485 [Pyrinomonadaceae bacterium]|jgi:hypothetical protein|nr:hypothetical protein [Pyrinomonadaceae bacterium]
MKNVLRVITFTAIVATLALPAFAQATSATPSSGTTTATSAQDDQAKADLYNKFLNNRTGDAEKQKVAYEAGKEYIGKYGSDKSEDNAKIVDYIQKWVTKYEGAVRDFQINRDLEQAFTSKNYSRAFELGRQRLSAKPDDVALAVRLAQVGFLNASAKDGNKSLNNDALNFTQTAIRLIEQGKTPEKWAPFTNQADALGWLTYTLGFLTLQTAPEAAPAHFIKAAQANSTVKNEASLYYYLSSAYFDGEYKKLFNEYKAKYEGKEETEESKALLARIDQATDRIIDALARTVALSTKPEDKAFRDQQMTRLTAFYKSRHQDSEAGLKELIAGIQTRPLPLPTDPVTAPATSTPSTTTTPAATGAVPPGGTATTTRPTTTTTQPAANTGSTAKPAPAATPKPASTTAPVRRP